MPSTLPTCRAPGQRTHLLDAALERARDWPRVLAQWCRHYQRSLGLPHGTPACGALAAASTGE